MTQSKTPANGESTQRESTQRRSTGVLSSAVERAARVAGRRTPSDGAISDEVVTARAAMIELMADSPVPLTAPRPKRMVF